MTTERYHRCSHCGVEYIYQGSGANPPKFNHATWCPGCYEAALEGMRAIPRRYECRYRPTREIPRLESVTLETLLDWEARNRTDRAARGELPITRIFTPLIDVESGDAQNVREIRGRDEFSVWRFRLATWRQKPEHKIDVPMEYDLEKKCFTGQSWR